MKLPKRVPVPALIAFGVALVALDILLTCAYGADIELRWAPPTLCLNGTPVANCPTTAYEISSAPSETGALTVIETVPASVTTKRYTNLIPGKYCYAVKTVSSTQKSVATQIVCTTLAAPAPSPPSNFTVTPVSTSPPIAMKDFPEHYVECQEIDDDADSRTYCEQFFDTPGIRGLQKMMLLGWMEGDTHGDPVTGVGYEKAKDFVDYYVQSATENGRDDYVHFWFEDKMYGSYLPANLDPGGLYAVPKYMLANPTKYLTKGYQLCVPQTNLGNTKCSGGLIVAMTLWDPDVEAAVTDFFRWFCKNYDSNPRVLSIGWGGYSVLPVEVPGFNPDTYQAAVKRILATARSACTRTRITHRVDWPGSYARALALVQWSYDNGIDISDYDSHDWTTRPGTITVGPKNHADYGRAAFFGYGKAANGEPDFTSAPGSGGPDFRGKMAYFNVVESPDWDFSRFGLSSIDEMLDSFANSRASYIIWAPVEYVTTVTPFTPANKNAWRDIVKPCLVTTTDRPDIGCTVAVRNKAISAPPQPQRIQ